MSVAGRWRHSTLGFECPIEIQLDGDTATIDHFLSGRKKVPKKDFYDGAGTVHYLEQKGKVEGNVIRWQNGVSWFRDPMGVPEEYTALAQTFPDLTEKDNYAICFNLKHEDTKLNDEWKTDPFFHWQGTYFELRPDGKPKGEKWLSKLSEIANENGIVQVETYFSTTLKDQQARVFWSPGKVRRWGKDVLWTKSPKTTTNENLLVLWERDHKWEHHEVNPEGKGTKHDLSKLMLTRITYPSFKLVGPPPSQCCADIYCDNDGMKVFSQAAWIDGSTVVRQGDGCEGRPISYVPSSFKAIRYVPLSTRASFLAAVSKVPTCALTGATVMPDSHFASPFSTATARKIGQEFGKMAVKHNVRVMSSASMRGHHQLMSADHDFTRGFCENQGCQAVHFKGSNIVALHGEAWEMPHGISYMLEEGKADFSNHAKESALMASLCSPNSTSFLANGGPTVAINLCRMLLLCGKGRVFTFTGLHSKFGKSGASGAFGATKEKLEASIVSMHDLAPEFFKTLQLPMTGDTIVEALKSRPLRLLNWDASQATTEESEYILKPEAPNEDVKPGVPEEHVAPYASGCAQELCKALHENGA